MTSMVERVAAAIGATIPGRSEATHLTPWTMLAARAAIEAMRTMSQPMLDACIKDAGWGDCEESEMQWRWNASIEAALKE